MDSESLKHLAELCRISLNEEEAERLAQDLKKIVHYVEQLKEVDTEGVEPCYTVHLPEKSVLRDDEVAETLDREEFLNNAPAHTGGMIRVPPVLHG